LTTEEPLLRGGKPRDIDLPQRGTSLP
jgi:hypothetical protein